MISAQYGTEFTSSHYEKIKKVYSIWICMNPPLKEENSITQYSLTETNLVGERKEMEKNYDLLTVIMICLGKKETKHDLLRLLNTLLSADIDGETKKRRLQMEFHIPMTQQLESEVETMCNLSDYVEQRGVEKGIQQGIKRGIDRINLLNMILLNANRMDDLKRASVDKKFQMELMKELLPKEVLD